MPAESFVGKAIGTLASMASFAAPFVYGDVLTALGLSGSLLRKLLEKKQSLEEVLLEPVEQLLKDKEIDRDWKKAIQKLSEDQKGLLILLDLLVKHLLDEQVYLKPLVEWLLENYKGKEKNYSEAQVIAKKIIEKIGEQKNEQHFIALKSLIQRLDAYGASSVNIRNFGAIIEDFYKQYKDLLFVGREDVIGELNAWLDDQNANPYLLLVALAGRGKSALLVHWLEELRKRQDLYLIFIPISARIGTNNLEAVKALAAFVANLCGEKVSTNCSSQQYAREIKSYLGRLGECLLDQQRVLIILDGLDEVNKYELFSNLFPQDNGQLGKLRVVVSARYLAGDKDATGWRERLGWPLDKVRVLELNLLDREAALAVIDRLSPGHPQRSELAGLLYRLSDNGDPLLIKLYADEIKEIIKRYGADRILSRLERFNPGLKGYFDCWFADLYDQQGWADEVPKGILEILDLLSGALAPLSKNELVALSGMHTVNLEKALSKLARFIVGDGEQRGYVFSHPRLAQYFWEDKLTESQRRALDQKFLDWGFAVLDQLYNGRLSPEQVPPYLVRALGSHLARVEAGPKDWLRLMHPKWAEASELVGDSLDFFLEDLDRAWRVCSAANEQAIKRGGQAPYLGGEIRCALLKASLHSKAELPVELLIRLVEENIWSWKVGLSYAYQMPRAVDRVIALAKLAQHLPPGQKLQVLTDALDVARKIIKDSSACARALVALAPHLSGEQNAQALVEALDIAQQITWPPNRAQALVALDSCLSDEQRAKVLNDVHQNVWPFDRAIVLAVFARHLSPEQREKALHDVQQIRYPQIRAKVIAELAKWWPDDKVMSMLDGFLGSIQQIQNPSVFAEVLAELAPCLSGEQLGKTLNIAQQFRSENKLVFAKILASVVPYLQDAQQLNEVWNEMQQFKNEFARAELLAALAPRLSPEQVNDAFNAAQRIDWQFARAELLAALAPHLLPEQVNKALDTALEIDDSSDRAKVLAALASRLSPEQLRNALKAIQQVNLSSARARVLAALASHLPTEQQHSVLNEALNAAKQVKNPFACAKALTVLAPHLPKDVLEATQKIDLSSARATVCAALVPHLPTEQKELVLGDVLNAAQQMTLYDRVPLLAALAPHFSSVERDNVLNLASQIENPQILAEVLTALAPHLSSAQLESALSLAQRIGNPDYRDQALTALIPFLPDDQIVLPDDQIDTVLNQIQRPASRVKALATLGLRLPDKQKQQALSEALATARKISDPNDCVKALAVLALHTQHLSVIDLYSLLRDTLQALADCTLPELLNNLEALVPALVSLGGQGAVDDTARAILDLTR
jgi:hypothetical protein